jgi:hypothetical protein
MFRMSLAAVPEVSATGGDGCCTKVGGLVVGSTKKIAVLVTSSALLPPPNATASGMLDGGGVAAGGLAVGIFAVCRAFETRSITVSWGSAPGCVKKSHERPGAGEQLS